MIIAGSVSDEERTPATPLASGDLVIALHCSGSGPHQWRQLSKMLAGRCELIAPEHFGGDQTGPWTGEHIFTLADEAKRTIALIDGTDRKVHLVGHSYGGGVALHTALLRPHRVASLALYEPSAFHLLKEMGATGASAIAEIAEISRETGRCVIAGDYRRAATVFVNYWGGPGAWGALPPQHQLALTRWAPKAPLDFSALIEAPIPSSAYAGLHLPVRLMRGEFTPAPTRLIAEKLAELLPDARLTVFNGAGHMGPFTHRDEVNALIISHLASVRSRFQEP